MEQAPFFSEIASGPLPVSACWLKATDGVRTRIAYWVPENARGTLLLCPGRTEFIEKYVHIAGALYNRGYATIVIDWRGQGLADRMLDDRRIGHVDRFSDFQLDLQAMRDAAIRLDLPRPWHILGHSMGGAIALRAVMEGFDVQSCVFSGPMWGIYMSALLRPIGWALAYTAPAVGLGQMLPPSTRLDNYVKVNPFEGNVLTTDPDMYKLMQDQIEAHPELALGGPSMVWFREALTESHYLSQQPSPALPCVTFLGDGEKIIDTQRVHDRMAAWPGGELLVIENAEHEVMMETPAIRARIVERMVELFDTAAHQDDTAVPA